MRERYAIACLALAMCLGTALAGCDRPPALPPDLLLLTVDTLRPDHLGIYGYERPTSPRIDAVFSDGAIFDQAYATEANTPPSVVSLLSGLYPYRHGVRGFYELLERDVALLPDRLPPEYQTAAFVSNIVLTDEALGIASRFDHYDDFVDERESDRKDVYERNATRTTDAAVAWLAEERDVARPLFLWVHYIDPHGPYDAPDDAPRRFEHSDQIPLDERRIQPYQRIPGVRDALRYVDRYDEEIAHVDQQLGRLIDAYSERWSLDDALVVFTADHGESMTEHGRWFTHGYHVWEEIIRVPLLIRGPDVEPGRRSGLVSGIDIVPTLLGAASVALPDPATGRTFEQGFDLRRNAERAERLVYAEATLGTHRWRAGRRGRVKWLFANDGGRIMPRLHFDLDADPDELRLKPWHADPPPRELTEMVTADPAVASAEDGRNGQQLSGPKIDPRVSDAQRRQLEALGYGETGASSGTPQ